MADISKCKNKQCPIKESCYRYTVPADPQWQSYCMFTYDNGKCDDFWDNCITKSTKK